MKLRSKFFSVFIIAFIGAALLRIFVFEGFIVRGDSMLPTITSSDYIFINKLAYTWGEPERGDIVVVVPRVEKHKLVKRIIGLPGERLTIEEGKVVIRNNRLETGTIIEENYLNTNSTPQIGLTTTTIDPQEYFAMGDNREVSIDSRELGLVDKWDIRGRVIGAFSFKTFKYRSF